MGHKIRLIQGHTVSGGCRWILQDSFPFNGDGAYVQATVRDSYVVWKSGTSPSDLLLISGRAFSRLRELCETVGSRRTQNDKVTLKSGVNQSPRRRGPNKASNGLITSVY